MIETPIDAIQWLKQKSSRITIGKDDYQEVISIIRNLVKERANLQSEVDLRDKLIKKLTTLPPVPEELKKQPFGTEGNGIIKLDFK